MLEVQRSGEQELVDVSLDRGLATGRLTTGQPAYDFGYVQPGSPRARSAKASVKLGRAAPVVPRVLSTVLV